MTSRNDRRRRPGQDAAPEMVTRSSNTDGTADNRHPALNAADARPWFNRLAWDEAFRDAAATGMPFSVDQLQAERNLPDLGNGCGGAAMAAHRAGLIRAVGWRPSTRSSRNGSIVTIWIGTTQEAA